MKIHLHFDNDEDGRRKAPVALVFAIVVVLGELIILGTLLTAVIVAVRS